MPSHTGVPTGYSASAFLLNTTLPVGTTRPASPILSRPVSNVALLKPGVPSPRTLMSPTLGTHLVQGPPPPFCVPCPPPGASRVVHAFALAPVAHAFPCPLHMHPSPVAPSFSRSPPPTCRPLCCQAPAGSSPGMAATGHCGRCLFAPRAAFCTSVSATKPFLRCPIPFERMPATLTGLPALPPNELWLCPPLLFGPCTTPALPTLHTSDCIEKSQNQTKSRKKRFCPPCLPPSAPARERQRSSPPPHPAAGRPFCSPSSTRTCAASPLWAPVPLSTAIPHCTLLWPVTHIRLCCTAVPFIQFHASISLCNGKWLCTGSGA